MKKERNMICMINDVNLFGYTIKSMKKLIMYLNDLKNME